MKSMNVEYRTVKAPEPDAPASPVALTQATMEARKAKVLEKMKERRIEQLILYGDVEHGANFEYLVGYFTRFEEGLLVLDKDGSMTLVLGNENLNKASKARFAAAAVHVSLFSLPNQPNRSDKTLPELLAEAGIRPDRRTGIVGWKMFTSPVEKNNQLFDIPAFILAAIEQIVGNPALLSNETDLFIGENGVRTTNNANEIAHYEFGAALASDCLLAAMNKLDAGTTEMELGDALVRNGQHTSVVTIAASGPRFIQGNMFPTDNRVKVGDPISLTVGYRGGLSSRAGYAVHDGDELPESCRDYLTRVVKPYFAAYVHWLETIRIGMKGGELFQAVESILPRAQYGWSLCPGHLTAEEEWMSSPVYEGSQETLASGMIFQIDIIPSVPGYGGVSAESTVVLADAQLKQALREEYPEVWQRMQRRRAYLIQELGITLSEDVLPMCGTVAYLRPYLLNKTMALAVGPEAEPCV